MPRPTLPGSQHWWRKGRPSPYPDSCWNPGEVLVEHTAPEGYVVASDSGYAAAVNIALTDELRAEGTAREIVRLVQNLRKSSGLEISDRIVLGVTGPDAVGKVLSDFEPYVKQETLAVELSHRDIPDPGWKRGPQTWTGRPSTSPSPGRHKRPQTPPLRIVVRRRMWRGAYITHETTQNLIPNAPCTGASFG